MIGREIQIRRATREDAAAIADAHHALYLHAKNSETRDLVIQRRRHHYNG